MDEEQVFEGQSKGRGTGGRLWREWPRGRRPRQGLVEGSGASGQVLAPRKPSSFPPPLAAFRSPGPERGALLLSQDRGGRAQGEAGWRAGAKAKGADTGWCLALHKGAVGAELFSARAAATGGDTARCPFAASRAQCWRAAPLWLPWVHCYCTSGSPPATGSTQGA